MHMPEPAHTPLHTLRLSALATDASIDIVPLLLLVLVLLLLLLLLLMSPLAGMCGRRSPMRLATRLACGMTAATCLKDTRPITM
jgi:hypothetical protein